MFKIFISILLFANIANANTLNDYGKFLSPDKFSTHCNITDIELDKNLDVEVYANNQINCSEFQQLYYVICAHMHTFLNLNNYDFSHHLISKKIVIHVLTLAELNNPENFSQTDSRCMHDIECNSGAFFGRTFYSDYSSNINVYVVYPTQHPPSWKYSFISSLKHELMHVILYRYRLNRLMNDKSEHKLINKFLIWDKSKL